jgi:hypothetical protein
MMAPRGFPEAVHLPPLAAALVLLFIAMGRCPDRTAIVTGVAGATARGDAA